MEVDVAVTEKKDVEEKVDVIVEEPEEKVTQIEIIGNDLFFKLPETALIIICNFRETC